MSFLKDFDNFRLSDAISFHDELNPVLWDGQELRPEVKDQLLYIAKDFLEELGVDDLDVTDITVSGSNAAFSYTPHSDLDLHILVDLSAMDNNEIYKELFNAKKTIYNDTHNITIHGVPVELYVQDAREPVVSLGEYSILNNDWLRIPTKRRANLDQTATKAKYEKLHRVITKALQSKNIVQVEKVLQKIKQYRQAGLDLGGEFGPENLAYKILRKQGLIKKLYELRNKLHDEELTIDEDHTLLNKPTPTIRQVAAKHGVSFTNIMDQLVKGVNVELEHTDDEKVAREIALDHLSEDPEYYTKLASLNLEDVDESLKSKLAAGALGAGMALGAGGAHAMDWKDAAMTGAMFVPGIGQVAKAYNIGSNLYQAAQAAKRHKELGDEITTLADKHNAAREQETKNVAYDSRYDSGIEPVDEGVNDNYLYHATQPAGIMRILKTGAIKASYRPQEATKAKTQFPTISTTRSKHYAESDEFVDFLNLTNAGNSVILVLDKNAIARHYKMFSTSQGTQTVGDEYEEVIVVPKGSMPVQGTLKGFYFNPKRADVLDEFKDIPWFKELYNSPFYMGPKQGMQEDSYSMNPGPYAAEKTAPVTPYGNKERQFRGSIAEASGYIPSEKEKNDPRFKTALTVDVKPDTIKKNAKAFSWLTDRAGIPPTLKPSGKF